MLTKSLFGHRLAVLYFAALAFLPNEKAGAQTSCKDTNCDISSSKTATSPAHADPLQQADENAAIRKSMSVIAEAFRSKESAEFIFKETNELKRCAGYPDADVKQIYVSPKYKQGAASLILIKGESSGFHLLMGPECSSLVVLTPIEAMMLSFACEDALKKGGSPLTTHTIRPTSAAKADEHNLVRYQTEVGFVTLSQEGKLLRVKIEGKDGKDAFEWQGEALQTSP